MIVPGTRCICDDEGWVIPVSKLTYPIPKNKSIYIAGSVHNVVHNKEKDPKVSKWGNCYQEFHNELAPSVITHLWTEDPEVEMLGDGPASKGCPDEIKTILDIALIREEIMEQRRARLEANTPS